MIREIDFGADQPTAPERIDKITASLNFGLTTVIGPANVNDRSFHGELVIGSPALRERTPWRSSINTWGRPLPCGPRIATRASLNSGIVVMKKALPYVRLPATIEALDDSLKKFRAEVLGIRDHQRGPGT